MKISEKTKLYIKNLELIEDLMDSSNNDSSKLFSFILQFTSSFYEDHSLVCSFSQDRNWQQIKKVEWDTKFNMIVHFEWNFDRHSLLTKNELSFFVDVEGQKSSIFLELFELLKYDKIIQAENFLYRPASRKQAILFKSYKLSQPLILMSEKSVCDFFHKVYSETLFMIKLVDSTLENFNLKIS
jgi:hypothetical protein